MHYKNGERAKVGHIVIADLPGGQTTIIGQVIRLRPETESCNVDVVPLVHVHCIERDQPVAMPATLHGGHYWSVSAAHALRIDMRPRMLRVQDAFGEPERAQGVPLATGNLAPSGGPRAAADVTLVEFTNAGPP